MRDLDENVEAAPCVSVVVGHRAEARELPWPSEEALAALADLREPIVFRGGARSFLLSTRRGAGGRKSPVGGLDDDDGGDDDDGQRHQRWSLSALAGADPSLRVLVRCSARGPSFPVPNGDVLPFYVRLFGPQAAPTVAAPLPLREAAERMQVGCPLPPLVFGSSSSPSSASNPAAAADVVSDGTEGGRREWYYIQSEVPRSWVEEEEAGGDEDDLMSSSSSSPLSALPLLLSPSPSSKKKNPGNIVSQNYRLWLSPSGAVSPLHYDTSLSSLAVLGGVKTFHFWTPRQTLGGELRPYPRWHLLRRRCAADPTTRRGLEEEEGEGDADRGLFGLFRRRRVSSSGSLACPPAALRAVVKAGDAIAFPAFWGHHVLSHNDDDGGGGGGDGEEAEQDNDKRGTLAPDVKKKEKKKAKTGRPIVALTRRVAVPKARMGGGGGVKKGGAFGFGARFFVT